jgi:hypothetical protein
MIKESSQLESPFTESKPQSEKGLEKNVKLPVLSTHLETDDQSPESLHGTLIKNHSINISDQTINDVDDVHHHWVSILLKISALIDADT